MEPRLKLNVTVRHLATAGVSYAGCTRSEWLKRH